RRLPALEHAAALVVRHNLVELPLLVGRVVRVMALDRLTEGRADEVAGIPELLGLAERRREGFRLTRLIRIPLQLRTGIGLVLDPVEPRRQQRREGEVRVRISPRDSALHAPRLAVADDAEAAGAVVTSPGDGGGSPALCRVALVGVDRGRDEQRELLDVVAHTAEEVPEDVGLLTVLVDEHGVAVL